MFQRWKLVGVDWIRGSASLLLSGSTSILLSGSACILLSGSTSVLSAGLGRSLIRRRVVRSSGLSSGYGLSAVECSWPRGGGDWRLAVIGRRSQLRISAGSLHMLNLSGYRGKMPFMSGSFLFRRWTGINSAVAAVIANPIHCRGVVDDRGVVNVMNVGYIHVGD